MRHLLRGAQSISELLAFLVLYHHRQLRLPNGINLFPNNNAPNNTPWNQRNSNNYNPNNYGPNNYNQNNYNDQSQDSTPAPVQVKPNKKPPAKRVVALKNRPAGFGLLSPINSHDLKLAGQVIRDETQRDFDTMVTGLGQTAKDPAVASILAQMQTNIDLGKPITQSMINSLITKAKTAGLPLGSLSKLQTAAGAVISASAANAAIVQALATNSGQSPGPLCVIVFPTLPSDTMCLLPGGCVLVGTDGQGQVGVIDGPPGAVLGLPLGVGEPLPDSDTDPSKQVTSGTLIVNPAENGAAVEYIVSNQNYSMAPGYSQVLTEGQSWIITFDRGEGHGQARYTLWDGTYWFGSSDKGWELFRKSFKVTIDNSANDGPFNYVVDNKQLMLQAGESKTHSSNYPIVVRFDRGDGSKESVKRITVKDAVLAVEINAADGCWDLYPPTSHAKVGLTTSKELRTDVASKPSRLTALLTQALQKKTDAIKWDDPTNATLDTPELSK